jgi:hypothetical protein
VETIGMARPLRILLAGGWYHVVSRGNRREALFWTTWTEGASSVWWRSPIGSG